MHVGIPTGRPSIRMLHVGIPTGRPSIRMLNEMRLALSVLLLI